MTDELRIVRDEDDDLLEQTLRSALRVPVPTLDEREARERAQRAIARARATRHRGRWVAAGVVGLAAAAAITLFVWSASTPAPESEPARLANTQVAPANEIGSEIGSGVAGEIEPSTEEGAEVRLPSGDVLVAASGARYDVRSAETHRRVELQNGSVLFDIARLDGGSFTVEAGDVEVSVRGTVFSVVREGEHVAVQVFEGSVEVALGERSRQLGAGEFWSSDAALASTEGHWQAEGERVASARTPARPSVRVPTERAMTLTEARDLLRQGDFAAALTLSETMVSGPNSNGSWRLLRADALRGLERWRDAASSYDDAIAHLGAARRPQAGYAAARIWIDRLQDAGAALDSLRTGEATRDGSPLEERARVLELRLLRRLGRDAEHRHAATAYLERFPSTATSFELRRELLGAPE